MIGQSDVCFTKLSRKGIKQQPWEIWSWIRIFAENPSVVCMMFWGKLWLDSPMMSNGSFLHVSFRSTYISYIYIYHIYIYYIYIYPYVHIRYCMSPFLFIHFKWLVFFTLPAMFLGTSQVPRTAISTTCQLGTRRTWDRRRLPWGHFKCHGEWWVPFFDPP